MAAVRVSSSESALAAAGDVVTVVSGWGKKGGGAPGALLAANAVDGVVLGCAVAAAAAEMPAAVAAGWRRSGSSWTYLIPDCQRASVEGRSRGGRAAGDSAPGGGEDETPSWRSASGGAECSNKTEEQHTQERHRRPEIRLISSITCINL